MLRGYVNQETFKSGDGTGDGNPDELRAAFHGAIATKRKKK